MIIGVTGQKRAGKDTTADFLVRCHKFDKFHFADKLKSVVVNLFDLDLDFLINEDRKEEVLDIKKSFFKDTSLEPTDENITLRQLFQIFGTDICRRHMPDIWVDTLLKSYYFKNDLDLKNAVIADVRFDSEAQAIKDMGGTIIKVIRPQFMSTDGHSSELGISSDLVSFKIINDGTIQDLEEQADNVLRHIIAKESRS